MISLRVGNVSIAMEMGVIKHKVLSAGLVQLMCIPHGHRGLQDNQRKHKVCQKTFQHIFNNSGFQNSNLLVYLNSFMHVRISYQSIHFIT